MHALGSIEYSVDVLEVPLVVVLGHERCGAVSAAVEVLRDGLVLTGNIAAMVGSILPAIEPVMGTVPDDRLVSAAVRANVRSTVERLRASRDEVIVRPRREGRLWIVGADYDLDTGRVDVFDPEES